MKKLLLFGIFIAVSVTMLPPAFAQIYPEGMISYWRFDEGSGAAAGDSVGGNDGTLINGPQWTTGIVGEALSFDGVDNRVSISDDSSLRFTSAMTLEAWINTPLTADMANGGRVFAKSDSSFSRGYALCVDSDGSIIFNTRGIDWSIVAHSVVTANDWNHIVATYDGSAKKIYVNGVEEASEGTTGSISTSNDDLWIGSPHYSDTTARMFNGLIDEAAVYNRALTPEKIQQHYQDGLKGLGYVEDTVIVAGCDTGVINVQNWNGTGASINDDLAVIDEGDYRNHGAYIITVIHFAETLLNAGVITEEAKGLIVSCAARSDIGKKN
jgi:hypothetical protein